MALVRLVVPWAITRTWRRAAVVSATQLVTAVQGPWTMTVRPAQLSVQSSTKVPASKTALLALTMRWQLWSVKVSVWIYEFECVTFKSIVYPKYAI